MFQVYLLHLNAMVYFVQQNMIYVLNSNGMIPVATK
jgi:hypothetical protein